MNFEAVELRQLTFKKNPLGGFRQADVNDFLRNVADDYETYDERIRRLIEDKDKFEKELSTKRTGQNLASVQLENEKKELQQKVQKLDAELQQLKAQKAHWDEFQKLEIEYQDIPKMKRIAQQTLEASEKAANRLMEEAERKQAEILAAAERQKSSLLAEAQQKSEALVADAQQKSKTLLEQAEEERLQQLFEAKLEISTLEKEQDDRGIAMDARQALLEQKYQELLQLKADIHDEVQTFAGMMTATRQDISQEYTNSIEALTKKNEYLRKSARPEVLTTMHVLEPEKEVM
ncbi:DivIVA domain-containing protein [Enterococcus sp. 669A]|uniref:DivIVA domain-containing protein n=1 Tax=Candidatus Enterococcus moelleringii TaxID=2815325 RepID=A0ABS3LG76_9ENTE|nr:DivIVA domain-containing protein [Enterococcus sp. 669A]MBO1308639.1 DivIVA domain-containing protein [Enterococcus sp. 669A]